MKRTVCFIMCILALLLFCACDKGMIENAPTQAQTETKDTETQLAANSEGGGNAQLKAFMARFDDTPTVGDKLLYEDDEITVNVHGINYAPTAGPELHLTIDNKTDEDITVQAPYAVVNDYMITPSLRIDVPAGKSANGYLSLPYFKLALADITCIKEVEFVLRAAETKSYNPLFTTGMLSLQTSAYRKNEKPEEEQDGQVAYDKNGVKIVLQGVNTDRAYSDGAELVVYMHNATNHSITVQTDDIIVNGYDLTSAMNRTLLPEKHAVDVVTFYKLDLEEYGIEEIDSVKISFELKDAERWDTLDTTDLISVELAPKSTEPPAKKPVEKNSGKKAEPAAKAVSEE